MPELLLLCTRPSPAGTTVVVEEFLDGEEASFFAFIDGERCVPLVGAQVSWLVWARGKAACKTAIAT